jgi:ElaB/YqjD/DUF883 family membrane-anchored ribosome-binding protein
MTTEKDTDFADTARTSATAEELHHHARAVKEDLRELGKATKTRATEYYEDGKEKSAEYYQQGKQRVADVGDRVEGYIREKPLQSVMIAAGAGALLGFLLTRR